MGVNNSELPQPNPSTAESTPTKLVTRRSFFGVLGAAAAAIGLKPKPAAAQLVPGKPPEAVTPKKPEVAPVVNNHRSDSGIRVVEVTPRLENSQEIKTAVEKKARIADMFLYTPPGQSAPQITVEVEQDNSVKESSVTSTKIDTPLPEAPKKSTIIKPALKVKLSPDDPKPMSQILLEATEQMATQIIDSNQKKDLVVQYQLAFDKYTKTNLLHAQKENIETDDLLKISAVGHLLDFSTYTDGISRENLYADKSKLREKFLAKSIALLMCEPDQVVDKLNKAPAADGSAMANLLLFTLNLLEACSKDQESVNKLGIKKKTLAEIVALSNNETFRDRFRGKGV